MKPRFRIGTATIAVFCCFLLVGLLGVHLKFSMFDQGWVTTALLAANFHDVHHTLLQKLGYYFNDIFYDLVLMPVVATTVVCVVFRRYRVGAAAVIGTLVSMLILYEQRALVAVGQYVSRDFLVDSIHTGISNPGLAGDYVSRATLLKFALLIAAFIAIWIIARMARRSERTGKDPGGRRYRLLLGLPALCVWIAAVLIAPVSFANRTPGAPLNASNLGRVASALLELNTNTGISGLSFDQALTDMRKLTHTPALDTANPLVGSERGANVLVFIMETGPARALDFATSGQTLPGAGQLFDHAFVARHHYTTYPYTSNAVYSILSGFYPQGRQRLLLGLQHPSLNGLMTAVGGKIQMRRVYMPTLLGLNVDANMYADFGAQTLYLSDQQLADPLHAVAERRAKALIAGLEKDGSTFDKPTLERLHLKLVDDFQALEKMKADITAAAHAHQRFCVAYLPQVAHGPWMPLHNEPTVLARGHDLMLLQDQWLAEIVDTLRNLGELDHTVIVFTGDHGVRTRMEDPALPLGKISDYMFHVPMLIYAPNALTHTAFIDAPSSHIDVAPTVLALLGDTDSVKQMEGIPLWQRGTQDRLYFWADAYGGVNGFEEDGTYYMRQDFTHDVFRNSTFVFPEASMVKPGDPAVKFTTDALKQANALQETIVSDWIKEERAASH